MQNLIKNLTHAYQTNNQAQFQELLEDSLTALALQHEDFTYFNDCPSEAYDPEAGDEWVELEIPND